MKLLALNFIPIYMFYTKGIIDKYMYANFS
jgi:hypothetical protein